MKRTHIAAINGLAAAVALLGLVPGAIASTALSELPRLDSVLGYGKPTVAIVGGGIAGLNAAYQLKKLGILATVYEAKSYLGGRIQSRTVVGDRLVNDLGGSFINTNHEDILALVEAFDRSCSTGWKTRHSLSFPKPPITSTARS